MCDSCGCRDLTPIADLSADHEAIGVFVEEQDLFPASVVGLSPRAWVRVVDAHAELQARPATAA